MSKLLGFARALLKVPEEKGLTEEQIDEQLLRTGAYADICEAASQNKLSILSRDEHRNLLGLPPLNPPILELVHQTFDCPATEAFNLDDFFITDNSVVKFGWVDADLKKYFKVQLIPAEGPRQLIVSKLTRTATEKELQTVAPQKTSWADLKWRLEQQPKGKSGTLLTNGWANIFFIGDCLVDVRWSGGGWDVFVRPVHESDEWRVGGQLVSRN